MAETKEEIYAQVRWVLKMGEGPRVEPGSFFKALIKAIHLADAHNLRKLMSVFPVYCEAVTNTRDWEPII